MLRVTTIHANSAHHSARYYTRYLADGVPAGEGVWLGRQADALGLGGTVSTGNLEAMLSGRDPVTGTQLGAELVDRVDAKGRLIRAVAGFDATFSAPKSLSVWWGLTGDGQPTTSTITEAGDSSRARISPPRPSRKPTQLSGGVMSGRKLSTTTDPVLASMAIGVAVNINAQDAMALIQWMQDVLGFDLVALYEDLDDGHVRASRLELGNHAVHVSQRDPSNTAPRNGVGIGVIAADEVAVDALYERAAAAGAEIVVEREHSGTGSYRFTVRDPEGDAWGVSTTWHDKPESLGLPERVI